MLPEAGKFGFCVEGPDEIVILAGPAASSIFMRLSFPFMLLILLTIVLRTAVTSRDLGLCPGRVGGRREAEAGDAINGLHVALHIMNMYETNTRNTKQH